MEIISKHLHGVNSGIWNVLGRGKRKTNNKHHIAAIQPSYQVQLSCLQVVSHKPVI